MIKVRVTRCEGIGSRLSLPHLGEKFLSSSERLPRDEVVESVRHVPGPIGTGQKHTGEDDPGKGFGLFLLDGGVTLSNHPGGLELALLQILQFDMLDSKGLACIPLIRLVASCCTEWSEYIPRTRSPMEMISEAVSLLPWMPPWTGHSPSCSTAFATVLARSCTVVNVMMASS